MRALLGAAAAGPFAGTREADTLTRAATRLDEPLRVALAGKVKAGKSTLLNALVGEELAPTDASECTRVVTWYRFGPAYRAAVRRPDGRCDAVPFTRRGGAIEVELGERGVDDVEEILVDWPVGRLKELTLVDTPGVASLVDAASARTVRFLSGDDGEEHAAPVDAVVYLLRHLHAADLRLLEAFHDDEVSRPVAINAVGVLSRADELGGGRLDAMLAARRIAERYRGDARLRRLCQTVVPVAGLLAQAAATLAEEEYRALARLTAAGREETNRLTLSADRFLSAETAVALTAIERAHLLGRLGVFGIRLTTVLIRQGAAPDATTLARELSRRSGIDELRKLLQTQFGGRAELLKARSALSTLRTVLRRSTAEQARMLSVELERVTSGAHVLVEVRTLQHLRAGVVTLPPRELADAERLLGSEDPSPRGRLGLDATASEEELRKALVESLERWQRRAENPLSPQPVVDVARVIVRTLEGLLSAALA